MNIFLDTAAFLAVLNATDQFHGQARRVWEEIIQSEITLFTSSYVVLETISLLQHRFGVDAVRLFDSDILPIVKIAWVDEVIHKQGLSALLTANRRSLSLVDCTSFEIMRTFGIEEVFTFDTHFNEQGFRMIPAQEDI